MKEKVEALREFLRRGSKHKTYRFAPVEVIEGKSWEITHEFNENDVREILQMEKKGTRLSFVEAYKKRWMELARQDDDGNWWLMHGQSIRTPIWAWARDRGYYIEFEKGDFDFQNIAICV